MGILIIVILFIVVILFIIISCLNLNMEIKVESQNRDDMLTINFKVFYGILRYKINIPYGEGIDNNVKTFGIKIKNLFYTNRYKGNRKNNKIVIKGISWSTVVGTGDAAETAIITGLVWGIKTNIIALIDKRHNLLNVYTNVIPNFDEKIFSTHIDCIFSIKIGYIINILKNIVLIKSKDGEKNE